MRGKLRRKFAKPRGGKNDTIDTLLGWHVSQLPGFLTAELDDWDDFSLQEASCVLASLFF